MLSKRSAYCNVTTNHQAMAPQFSLVWALLLELGLWELLLEPVTSMTGISKPYIATAR
jgi:hypothetical protein